MKAVKRKFIDGDEILRFTVANNFEIERYFNANNLNFENNTLNLWFDHSYAKIADTIAVEAIYFDFFKKIEKYETVEFVEVFNVSLPKENILKQNEFFNSNFTSRKHKILMENQF